MRPLPLLLALATSLCTAACASTAVPRALAPDRSAAGLRVEVPRIAWPDGETPEWWFRSGAAEAAARGAMAGRARNVILFVGDGMSLATVAAARIFEGQRRGASGEENLLAWESFPHTALVKTYNTNSQTPDSAGTMTAMATGIKTRLGVLGVDPNVARGDCAASLSGAVPTLWELAAAAGMATGVVTTTQITNATPAATFSHAPERDWESDTRLAPADHAAGCIDIARQMIESPLAPEVLMGGGRAHLMPDSQRDPEYPDIVGRRADGRDLIAEWKRRHPRGHYAWNLRDFADAPADAPLLALFEPGHMHYEHDRALDLTGEPSLAQMTSAAIRRLARNPNGYVLLVEGGRIDHAHHAGNAYRALVDTIAMADAVQVARDTTEEEDTLILVTADHSHTMSFGGYPRRGNPILGKVHGGARESTATVDPGRLARDATGLPYTTLNYATGPGYVGLEEMEPEDADSPRFNLRGSSPVTSGRPDLTDVDTGRPDYRQEAVVPSASGTHGGDDVGAWAWGSGSAAVRGTLEQHAIFHIMLQANPRLRALLCSKGLCDASGVPVRQPSMEDVRPQ